MKKLCCVTAARSEYGLLKWIMKDIDASDEFELQLIVTGGHLSYDQGHTIDQIIDDEFKINYIVDAQLDTSSTARIAESMGRMAEGIAKAFEELNPNYLLVLGDRYELLPICNTAFVMCIPIIHLSGGDITEG
ncbi:MAG: UDP-N-acetylglucosamine 2-epimerase, partial [Lachnospiraceae bacterium]|nr:UDP-N-acetylglucosamine 2-epimerase [Lachnospiraceae bacterium]